MRSTLFLLLAQARLFWKARFTLSQLVFVAYRMLFGMRHRIREESTTTKSLLSLLRNTWGALVWVVLTAVGLQFLNPYLVPWFTKRGFTILPESDYGTLLATVVGVGGVFIGLYYAAISAIGGAIYAKVPNNIRDLLAHDRVGNAYMRYLAALTFFGVCLLAFHTLGLEPVILAVPIFTLGAGLVIVGFVRLGARAFYLFDPTSLSYRLFEQLRRCHLQIQAGGYRWSDQSFQKHAHRVAQTAIDTLATVSDIAARELHLNGRPFAGLCKGLLSFLLHYETAKKSIPTDSHWYEERYVHPDWYRAGDTETSMAHQTATGLRPQSIRDPRWIESAILPIVQRCLELNIRKRRYDLVFELLSYLDAYVQRLAKEHQIEIAFKLVGDVFSWCGSLIFVNGDKAVAEDPLEHMAICDWVAGMPINVLIAYGSTIESYRKDAVLRRIRKIKWKSEKSIYRARFALPILKQLEWLRPRLEFEERVEGHIVSPAWYLQELITQKVAENLSATMNCFHSEACKLYEHWIKAATSSKHPWLAALMMCKESEYWNKLDYRTKTLNQLWSDLNSDRRLEGLSWPSLSVDDLTRKKARRKMELMKLMSDQSVLLSLMSRPKSYPDFAGQFLHAVGEALLTALCENDSGTVKALFKRYLYGSLVQFERLKPKEAKLDWRTEIDMKIAVAPLLDLLDVSGYACLLSEYHDASYLKEIVAKDWDEYLDQGSAKETLRLLAVAVSLTEAAVELAHRSIIRTGWKQTVERRLKDVERREAPRDGSNLFVDFEPVVMHKSPLVRIFARKHLPSSHDGIDIFLEKYVRQREGGKDLDFGWRRRRDIEDEIEREERRYREVKEKWDTNATDD